MSAVDRRFIFTQALFYALQAGEYRLWQPVLITMIYLLSGETPGVIGPMSPEDAVLRGIARACLLFVDIIPDK